MPIRIALFALPDYAAYAQAVAERLTRPYPDAADETEQTVLDQVAMALTFGGQRIPDHTSALSGFAEVLEGAASAVGASIRWPDEWPGDAEPLTERPDTGDARDPLSIVEHPNEFGIELYATELGLELAIGRYYS